MNIDPDRIFHIASAVLTATANGLEAHGIAAPQSQAVIAGTPAFDDEMLYVSMARVVQTDGTPDGANRFADRTSQLDLRSGEFLVWLVRPSVTFDEALGQIIAPSADEYEAEAVDIYSAMTAGITGMREARRERVFGTNLVYLQDVTIIGPDGGFVGVLWRWLIGLSDAVAIEGS